MPKKVRSARGVILDFDLFLIKKEIAARPKTMEVKAREDFIERKLRRRQRQKAAAAVEPALPGAVDSATVEVSSQPEIIKKNVTRQRTKPKKKD